LAVPASHTNGRLARLSVTLAWKRPGREQMFAEDERAPRDGRPTIRYLSPSAVVAAPGRLTSLWGSLASVRRGRLAGRGRDLASRRRPTGAAVVAP
jgi:hypothetical protein